MTELLFRLLNLSISASIIILIVILFRSLLARRSRRAACLLWIVAALRLLIPFSPETGFGLMPADGFVPMPEQIEDQVIAAESKKADADFTGQPVVSAETPGVPVSSQNESRSDNDTALNADRTDLITDGSNQIYDTQNNESDSILQTETDNAGPLAESLGLHADMISHIVFYIWIAGIASMLAYALISCLRLRKTTAESVLSDDYYICDHISSPFILGIFKPMIFVPSGLSEIELKNVLAHENAHIKRLDHVWKPLGFLILSVYWFNPFVWIAYSLLSRDIEYACDETAITYMSHSQIRNYSETLLACGINAHPSVSSPLAFGEISVKNRIKAVLNYKKPAFWIVITSLVLCVGICILFMTKSSAGAESAGSGSISATNDITDGTDDTIPTSAIDTTDGTSNTIPASAIDNTDTGITAISDKTSDNDINDVTTLSELLSAAHLLDDPSAVFEYHESLGNHTINCDYTTDDRSERKVQAIKYFNTYLLTLPAIRPIDGLPNNDPDFGLTIRSATASGYEVAIWDQFITLSSFDPDGSNTDSRYYEFSDTDFIPDYDCIRRIFFQEEQYRAYANMCDYSEEITGLGVYSANKGYLIDLDGDGVKERLFVTFCGVDYWSEPASSWIKEAPFPYSYNYGNVSEELIYVNGKLANTYAAGSYYSRDSFAVVDIDSSDKCLELIVDTTANVVSSYRIYAYRNGAFKINELFWFADHNVYENDAQNGLLQDYFPGDGFIYGTRRLEILDGQFFTDCVWKLDTDGAVSIVSEMYYPWQTLQKKHLDDDDHKLWMEMSVMASTEPDPDSGRVRIEPGKVIPDITDGKHWLHIISEDGITGGWIDTDNLRDYIVDYDSIIREDEYKSDADSLFSNIGHAG